ncbi:MAG: nickel-dependent lactate racemase [Dehalococcoidia bacterium]
MKIDFAYGRTGLRVDLPNDVHVLTPAHVPALADPAGAIREALRKPMGCAPLQELVMPGDTVAIVFSDVTRPVPNKTLIPVLLEELAEAGIDRRSITLINALGMHRVNTLDELESLLSRDIVESFRVVQHNPEDEGQLTRLVREKRGTSVDINRYYMQARVKILTGLVEPHIFAGYSGGGKAVLPGIAGADAVMSNHSGPMVGHPKSTWCSVEGNPIFREIREVALATDPTFLLNVTIDQNKAVTGVFAGSLVEAHDAGIAFAEKTFVQPIPQEFDIAVTSNLGYPSDINLYQSFKGLSVAAQGVRMGGAVVMAAECADGLGLIHFQELLEARSQPERLLEMIRDRRYRHHDQWGVQVGAMAMVKVESHLYSSMKPALTRKAHMIPCKDVSKTVNELRKRYRKRNGGEPSILALPYGQLTVPRVTNG